MRIVVLLLLVAVACVSCVSDEDADRAIRGVVLISIDTCRADRLGCYGNARATTPAIDALAARGALFRRAYSPVPLTLPAHASMMTGTDPPTHGVRNNATYRLAEESLTLAELLSQHGFATGAVVSAFVLDSRFGLDQGFDSYDDRFDVPIETNVIVERRGDETTRHAIDWLGRNASSPFFLFLHYYDPHMDYAPPEPFASDFADDPYSGEIAFVDAAVGEVVDELKRLGVDESTAIVVTADHGEMLGEHGEETHGWFLYESAIHVPLVIRVPGFEPTTIERPVGLIDLLPTICGLLDIPIPRQSQGIDLSPLVRGARVEWEARELYCESLEPTKYGCNPLLGLVTEQWKVLETTRPELYDLLADPEESTNVLGTAVERAAQLRGLLTDLLKSRARGVGAPADLGDEERRRLEALGYLASGGTASGHVEPGRCDPKDLLGFHLANLTVPPLIVRGELAEATRRAEELLARRPDFATARVYLARIAREEGRFEDATAHYEAALEIGPLRPGLLVDLGVVLALAGRLDDSRLRYRDAIEIDPDHVEARNNLGNALLANGETGEALEHYRRALNLRPDSGETRINMAIAYLRMNDTEAALEQLAVAEAGVRETDRALLELLASVYAAAGRPDRAAEIQNRSVVEERRNE